MTEEAVARGAKLMAEAEKASQTVQARMLALPKVFNIVRDGVVGMGALEAQALGAEAKALAGLAANLEAELVEFHRRLTARAQELGIDLPQPRSGGR